MNKDFFDFDSCLLANIIKPGNEQVIWDKIFSSASRVLAVLCLLLLSSVRCVLSSLHFVPRQIIAYYLTDLVYLYPD